MQVMMKVPFWEAKFDITEDKAAELARQAFTFAAEQKTPVSQSKAETAETETPPAQEKSGGGAFRTFGDFKIKDKGTPDRQKANGYKGFLIVKCERCGNVRGFRAKTPITHSFCGCGHKTELYDLADVRLDCKCGKSFFYKTNITDGQFDFPCLNCGNPVDLELDKRGTSYVTIS